MREIPLVAGKTPRHRELLLADHVTDVLLKSDSTCCTSVSHGREKCSSEDTYGARKYEIYLSQFFKTMQ